MLLHGIDTNKVNRLLCYVYSLPPCYFTQSALPIYQTGCCSVCYTCDLSRVTDCARCRLFAQLGRTFELNSRDREQWSLERVDSFTFSELVVSAYDRTYISGVKLLCQEIACLTLWTSVTYSFITLC